MSMLNSTCGPGLTDGGADGVDKEPPVAPRRQIWDTNEAAVGGLDYIRDLPSFREAGRAFSEPLGTNAAFPDFLEELTHRIGTWSRQGAQSIARLGTPPVFRQVFHFGSLVFDTHRLLKAVHVKRLDDWKNSPSTAGDAKAALESWLHAFWLRYDAVRALTADILLSSNLTIFAHPPHRLLIANIRKLARVFAGENYSWGTIGVALGLMGMAIREHRLLAGWIRDELAAGGICFHWLRDRSRVQQMNALAGEVLITERHWRQLVRAFRMLEQRGVVGEKADEIVLSALRQGDRAASKPWKGLVKLTQLVVHAGVDPQAADFIPVFHAMTSAPIQYTYTPGLEWIVRDYELGKKLLQMDGRIPDGCETAPLQQGRVSVMPGIGKATPGATEFARKYFGPVENFLQSMVTADGTDHQRLRKPFMQHFSRRAVFDLVEHVQSVVCSLLDEAEHVAKTNHGAFDFKKDFAFQFPIRIICGVVGIHGEDIAKIQRWTEESTRSMDTEAGVSLRTATRGQKSTEEQRRFFGKLLEDARRGQPCSEMVRTLAADETLSESERIANLSVIVFAGFETTTGLLCKGVSELLKHPEQWAYLRNSLVVGPEICVEAARPDEKERPQERPDTHIPDTHIPDTHIPDNHVPDTDLRWFRWAETEPREADPGRRERIAGLLARSEPLRDRYAAIRNQESHLEAAVEEMLRWCAPGSIIPLTASQDLAVPVPRAMVVRGIPLEAGDTVRIAKGETVTISVDEINRNCPLGPGKFDIRGDGSFDVSRTDNSKHLSFGVKHMCIGATMARENAKRALEGVLRRFPDLQANGTPIPQDMELFNGLAAFPVCCPSLAGSM